MKPMNEDNYKVIATKLSPDVYERITRIAKKKGMTPYELIQMVCDTIVRYMDDTHNLAMEMEQAMSIFEHMVGWKDALNLADPSAAKEIAQAVYVLTDPTGKKKGCRATMVDKPYFGEWNQTENVQVIFERMVEVLLPGCYRKLRRIAVDMECGSLVELLTLMIDSHDINLLDEASIRKDFEDCNRSDYGKPVEYGNRAKRKHHKGMEIYDRQQMIDFNDKPELGKDYEPFGTEY